MITFGCMYLFLCSLAVVICILLPGAQPQKIPRPPKKIKPAKFISRLALRKLTLNKDADNSAVLMPPWKVCPSGQEGAQVPIQSVDVKDTISMPSDLTKDNYMAICVEPYGPSCTYPGSFVAFSDLCSLQCQCMNEQKSLNLISSDFHYANCRSICSTPPNGLRCFSKKENGSCCPTYEDCVNSPFDGQWTKDRSAFISSRFRCSPGDQLDSATCLMVVKEAIPEQSFSPKFRAKCQCVAEDMYKISITSFISQAQPNAGKTKFALIRDRGQIRNQRL
ncbi:uncharacterized protein LOC129590684 [Paramacrobiotus metropolitanus]|uniref:uncharacterized protein LOC129590684 n=1 Tax=Paramacrobiotus metropolitanus TaxID=2943436 RepID=UPI002445D533|nr:uncharacterized protein LOC129590684 [Paramacrobiotus metropolitanus]